MVPDEGIRGTGDHCLCADTRGSNRDHRHPHEHVRPQDERDAETQTPAKCAAVRRNRRVARRGERCGSAHLIKAYREALVEKAIDVICH